MCIIEGYDIPRDRGYYEEPEDKSVYNGHFRMTFTIEVTGDQTEFHPRSSRSVEEEKELRAHYLQMVDDALGNELPEGDYTITEDAKAFEIKYIR